ncbi:FecCD family ABC transporter permease [Tissierella simiarum]|nr:iron ABC transporter permease [Tissierella simiarum]
MNMVDISIEEKKKKTRGITVLSILSILIIITFIISINTGYIRLSPIDVIRVLFGGGTDKEKLILFDFRLPRIVISIMIGAGLSLSGCIMQGVSRNALADPGILGINSGAGLMVVLFVSFFSTNSITSIFFLPFLALIGAGLTATLIYVLAYKKHEGISPTRLLLTGIAVQSAISAAMIVLTIRLNPEKFKFVSVWLAGSIWEANWKFVLALLPWLVILIPFVFYKAKVLNVMNMGDQIATGFGVEVEKERRVLLASAVALAGSCVAVSGGISFVGLIAPHLARRLVGPKHEFLLPASALTGSLLVVVADTLGRWIVQPSEIPTGIVVAIVGAPYFLYLLAKTKE